jgi:hypothetical protein
MKQVFIDWTTGSLRVTLKAEEARKSGDCTCLLSRQFVGCSRQSVNQTEMKF